LAQSDYLPNSFDIQLTIYSMKTCTFFLSVVAVAAASFTAQATVHRVNNLPGVDANYTTMTAAISGAAIDDTLLVEGSYISYGVVTLNKRLTVIGTGYFITSNDTTQAYPSSSRFDRLVVSGAGAGSTITGIHVENTSTNTTVNPVAMVDITAADVSIIRCYFWQAASIASSVYSGVALRITANNVIVTQSFIYQSRVVTSGSTTYNTYAIRIEGSPNGIVISNNIIKHGNKGTAYDVFTQRALNMTTSSSANIVNNVFSGRMDVYNSVFQNNIQISGSATASNSFNQSGSFPNVVANNIGNSTQFGTSNGNQSNVTMTNVFTYTPGNENTDNHYRLKAGSPAIAAGISGEDCGAFGGQGAYRLSGIPSIPAIFQATIPATGNTGDGLNFTIKAKAHN
jgi:hypothetical protein